MPMPASGPVEESRAARITNAGKQNKQNTKIAFNYFVPSTEIKVNMPPARDDASCASFSEGGSEDLHFLDAFGDPEVSAQKQSRSEGAAERVAGQKFASRINLQPLKMSKMTHATQNSIKNSEKKAAAPRQIGISRDSRATVQQCLDDRTLRVLHKFLQNGLLESIHGCISTGKEANVYAATTRRDLVAFYGKDAAEGKAGSNINMQDEGLMMPSEPEGDAERDSADEVAEVFVNDNYANALKSSKMKGDTSAAAGPANNKGFSNKMPLVPAAAAETEIQEIEQQPRAAAKKKNNARYRTNPLKAQRLAKSANGISEAPTADENTGPSTPRLPTGITAGALDSTCSAVLFLAVKVFKTSVLVFKDRARYTEGDYRFRHSCTKGNPRKVVAQWCEKEYRNLMRIRQKSSGWIKTPFPVEHRGNVLVMTLLGNAEDGVAAPRLKDVKNEDLESVEGPTGKILRTWEDLYLHCCRMLRDLFANCNLVHGDLSEYNLLYFSGELYMIDVSQSVEMDHPQALDFLKRDCQNVSSFFQKNGVDVLPLRSLYQWVVSDVEEDLVSLFEGDRDQVDFDNEEEFRNTWVPSNLHQISEVQALEKDIDRLNRGENVVVKNLLAACAADLPEGLSGDEEDFHFHAAAGGKERDHVRDGGEAGEHFCPEAAGSGGQGGFHGLEDFDASDDGNCSGDGGECAGDARAEVDTSGRRPPKEKRLPEGSRDPNMSKAEWKAHVKKEKEEKRLEKIPKKLKKKHGKKL
eukprot:g9558.t1